MSRTSLPTGVVVTLVLATAIAATGLGYLWANSKKDLPVATAPIAAPATPYVYMPSFDAPALINLAPDVFAELERRCQTKQHPTCDTLKSDAVRKARQASAGNIKTTN